MTNLTETSPEVQLYAANGDTDAKTAFMHILEMHPVTRRSWTEMGNAVARLIAEAEQRAIVKGMEMALMAVEKNHIEDHPNWPNERHIAYHTGITRACDDIRALITQEQNK